MSEENDQKFLQTLIQELELDSKTNFNSSLDEIGWDSLSVITVIAVFDEVYSITLTADKLKDCKTIKDLADLSKV